MYKFMKELQNRKHNKIDPAPEEHHALNYCIFPLQTVQDVQDCNKLIEMNAAYKKYLVCIKEIRLVKKYLINNKSVTV